MRALTCIYGNRGGSRRHEVRALESITRDPCSGPQFKRDCNIRGISRRSDPRPPDCCAEKCVTAVALALRSAFYARPKRMMPSRSPEQSAASMLKPSPTNGDAGRPRPTGRPVLHQDAGRNPGISGYVGFPPILVQRQHPQAHRGDTASRLDLTSSLRRRFVEWFRTVCGLSPISTAYTVTGQLRMMLHQSRTEARFQPQGRKPSGLAKGLCVAPAQGFVAFPEVCHWTNGPQGGGVAPWAVRSSVPATGFTPP